MKKLLTTVLLLTCFLSTNLFAMSLDEQESRIDEALKKQSASYEDDSLSEQEKEEEANEDEQDLIALPDTVNQNQSSSQISSLTTEDSSNILTSDAYKESQRRELWEKQRIELDNYIAESYWVTWKLESIGDVQLAVSLNRLGFLPVHIAAQAFGVKDISDRLEDFVTKQLMQNKGKMLDPISTKHRLETLYVKIQYNAFNLLKITTDDYFNLIREYPEVKYLFDDLYVFFKWRAHLHDYYDNYVASTDPAIGNAYKEYLKAPKVRFHTYLRKNFPQKVFADYLQAPNDYRYNEYLMYKVFRRAVRRNSFLGWSELALIAKRDMLQAMETDSSCLSNRTAADEKASIQEYAFHAHNALEAGRFWNGKQRYAVFKLALPHHMRPTLGAGVEGIKKQIRQKMKGLSKEEIKAAFMQHRQDYLKSRQSQNSEVQWKLALAKDVKKQDTATSGVLTEQENYDNINKLFNSHQCIPAQGEEVTIQNKTDPIAADFTFLDEIAARLEKLATTAAEKAAGL